MTTAWIDAAACAGRQAAWEALDLDAKRAQCADCPVAAPCLAEGRLIVLGHVAAFLAVGDTGEVWGGRTEAEIAREVRRERRGAA
jgi:hypothetical protein